MNINFPVHYIVQCKNPEAHLFEIECIINSPNPDGQIMSLPNWIPGSYMIRDFAKNITEIKVNNKAGTLKLKKINKNTWKSEPSSTAISIIYTVYAFDLSVRSAHLDTAHAFFNGTSLFLKIQDHENTPCSIELIKPTNKKYINWKVATTLPNKLDNEYDFGLYHANNYDELIDHPVEIGEFTVINFKPNNINHQIIITGRHQTNEKRLAKNLTKICNTHIKLFGEFPNIKRYLFLTMVVGTGYGGLEHRASTSLVCSRKDLVNTNINETTKHYRQFLALCSHEYFHTWNVKRIKPEVFIHYDLDIEAYTQQLWAFEGITSYYDELALVRSGVITTESYLELLSQTITQVSQQYGRFTQSVADSSFDAWTKFYKQDENAPNAIVSYYTKGTLIALSIDFCIRNQTNNSKSLDDVMRYLWLEYGKKGIGLKEAEIEKIINKVTKLEFNDFFSKYLYGTNDLPLDELFQYAGIEVVFRAADNQTDLGGKDIKAETLNKVSLGIKTKLINNQVIIQQIINNSCAQLAGLSAGDELVSFDGFKVNNTNLKELLSSYAPNDKVEIFAFRRDELLKFEIILKQSPLDTCVLTIKEDTSKEQNLFLNKWLHTNIAKQD